MPRDDVVIRLSTETIEELLIWAETRRYMLIKAENSPPEGGVQWVKVCPYQEDNEGDE